MKTSLSWYFVLREYVYVVRSRGKRQRALSLEAEIAEDAADIRRHVVDHTRVRRTSEHVDDSKRIADMQTGQPVQGGVVVELLHVVALEETCGLQRREGLRHLRCQLGHAKRRVAG